MADKRIDQLTAATSLGDSDLLVVEQSSEAKKATGTVVLNYINSKFGLSGMASVISTLQTAVAGKQDALTLPISIAQGGTDATTAGNARANLGLGTAATADIDNTLAVQGAAADAKSVGDKIADVNSVLDADYYDEGVVQYNSFTHFSAPATSARPAITRYGNLFSLNGTYGSANGYWKLSEAGSTNWSTSKSNAKGWPKEVQLIADHVYQAKLTLISGDYTVPEGSVFNVTIFDSLGGETVIPIGSRVLFSPGECTINAVAHGQSGDTFTDAKFVFSIRDVTEEQAEIEKLDSVTEQISRNLVDEKSFFESNGYTNENGIFSGTVGDLYGKVFFQNGENETQYSISIKYREITNMGTGKGLMIAVRYVGESSSVYPIALKRNVTELTEYRATTDEGKTVDYMAFSLNSGRADIIELTDFQVEKGRQTVYHPYGELSAVDRVLRNEVDSANTKGMAYSWWVNNRAVDSYGNLYFGYISEESFCGVGCRFPDGTIQRHDLFASEENDDHNAPSVIIVQNNGKEYVCVIGSTGHNTDSKINVFLATEPNTIRCEFADRTHTITSPEGYKLQCSYSQAYFDSSNSKIYNFFRVKQIETATSEFYLIWMCAVSADFGLTWSIYRVFDTGRASELFYMWSVDTEGSSVKRLVLQTNTTNTLVRPIRTGFVNLSTLDITDGSGASLSKPMTVVADGDLPYDTAVLIANYDDFSSVISTDGYKRFRILDVWPGNSLNFLYAESVQAVSDHHDITDWILYRYSEGSKVEIAHLGLPFFVGSCYVTGACMVGSPDDIVYSKNDSATQDGAHSLHHAVLSNGSVTADKIFKWSNQTIARPVHYDKGGFMVLVGQYREGQGTKYLTWHFGIDFFDVLP